MKKGKMKWIIIGALGSFFPLILIIAVIGSGVSAVTDFFSDMGEKIGDFFTGEDALEEIVNNEEFTEEDFEGWMITREGMVCLLEKTEEFNHREARTKTFNIEGTKTWSEYEPSPTPKPTATTAPTPKTTAAATSTQAPVMTAAPSGSSAPTQKPTSTQKPTVTPKPTATPTPFVPKIIDYSEKEETSVILSEDQALLDRYKVDWQFIYLLCIYRYIDDTGKVNGVVNVGEYELDAMLDSFAPKVVYEFDPIEYWKNKTTLSESDIQSHPYNVVEYDESVSNSLVVGGTVHHKRLIPRFKVKEIVLPYCRDVYRYMVVPDGSGGTRELVSYDRQYDKDRFLALMEPYLGVRDIDVFLIALDEIPGMEGLVNELRELLKEE